MDDDAVTVIPARGRLAPLREAWGHRGVFRSLALREVAVRYRQAWLGAGWALVQPLALMAVATLVFHRFLGVGGRGPSYALFAYTGLFAWTFFHTAVSAAVPTFVQNASLVRKIWFPREALVVGAIAAAALDLAAGAVLWVVLVAASGGHVVAALVSLLPAVGALVVAATGPALLGAAVNVYYRDVKHALPLLLQVVFFATPIVYPLDVVPAPWRDVLAFNPLTGVVEGLRAAALDGRGPAAAVWIPGAATSLAFLLLAYAVFVRAGRRFADAV